jgi:hypothetical protein
MEKTEFTIIIDASKEKVWDILWNPATYPEWTSPFGSGSWMETNWQKGDKVRFLSPEGEGIVSVISETIPCEFMAFEQKGFVKDGVEDYTSDLSKKWEGSLEYYRLTSFADQTELVVDIDVALSHKDYFLATWPKALLRVKELAEKACSLVENGIQ